jgi:type I restriction enzyme, R subunit
MHYITSLSPFQPPVPAQFACALSATCNLLKIDADVLSELLELKDPNKSKELEIKIIARLRKHKDHPKFIELGRRLEELKQRHEQGLPVNLAFVKQLLEIAREVVEAEKEVDPINIK